MSNVKNKVAVVIGGKGLLGSEFAKILREKEATVVIGDIVSYTDMYYVDITNENSIIKFKESIIDTFKKIDILINCAAVNPQITKDNDNKFETYNLEKWKRTLDVNLTGTFLCCREFGKWMIENKHKGTIINVTSQLGLVAPQQNIYNGEYIKPVDYGVSAAGIINLTKYLSSYWGEKIKINTLVPSMVYNNQSEDFVKRVSKKIPINRMSNKDEYNSALLFLCDPDNSYMTGHSLIIDGGYTII